MLIADGTILRLHELLSEEYKARHEVQAGAKFHLLHNATEKTIECFEITHEKTYDSSLSKTGSWLQGQLILFDLAYFKYRRFVELLFRELKTQYELDEFDTSDPAVVEILVYAALFSLLLNLDLLGLVTELADDEIVFPPER